MQLRHKLCENEISEFNSSNRHLIQPSVIPRLDNQEGEG